MDAINQQIEREIELQRANLESKRGAIYQQKNLLAMAMDATGDEYQARLLATSALRESVARDIESYGMQFDSLDAQEKSRQMAAAIRQQTVQDMVGFGQAEFENRMRASQNALGWAQLSAEQARIEAARASGPDPSFIVVGVADEGGQPLLYKTEKFRNEIPEKKAATESFLEKTHAYISKYNEITNHGANPRLWANWLKIDEGVRWLNTMKEDLIPSYSIAKEQGVVREHEYPRYDRMFGDPTSWRPDNWRLMNEAVTALTGAMESEMDARLRNTVHGYGPETRRFDPVAKQWYIPPRSRGDRPPGASGTISSMIAPVAKVAERLKDDPNLDYGVRLRSPGYKEPLIHALADKAGTVSEYDVNDPKVKEDIKAGRLEWVTPTSEKYRGRKKMPSPGSKEPRFLPMADKAGTVSEYDTDDPIVQEDLKAGRLRRASPEETEELLSRQRMSREAANREAELAEKARRLGTYPRYRHVNR
jgi:hypothetical protein